MFIASTLSEVLVLFTSLQNIVILSVIAIVRAGDKSTNNVRPHNGTNDRRIFVIFSKTGFVDIVPLCYKPLIRWLWQTDRDIVVSRWRHVRDGAAWLWRQHNLMSYERVLRNDAKYVTTGNVASNLQICMSTSIIIIIIIIISRQCLWCCHHGRAIARVHPVHLMNVERRQAAADPRPSQTT